MRSKPLQRGKGFKRPQLPPRERPKLFPVKQSVGQVAVMRRADEAANEVRPVPKQPREENPRYRAMAAGKPCLLRVPGVCNGDWSTTVLAHSNSLSDNKGKGMKAHDHAGVWACFGCHFWLDQDKTPTREERRERFSAAMVEMRRQIEVIAASGRPRDREAAQWALARMGG
ncbi:nuclease domain-containing protein [Piscinibacter gummiphilus]|uniref:Nuclease domain-containing protein n=1 Tax=Piscinibacter gummiphilus TaxID=946333 RepID=A0ABZ0CUB1_9BURK|nr:nuclease domain-containing protein [Piscinibacter gummiphilus]WOB06522.1 nuclease domain-containing protein [Piscinibacter gummiphilus]